MQIIVIGKSYSAKKLAEKMAQNKNNIVFLTKESEFANQVDINPLHTEEIKEFISANDIHFCVIADEDYINEEYDNLFTETEAVALYPDFSLSKLYKSLSSGKKFVYKNKIQTTKFAVFEKSAQAVEYLQTANFPVVISPDEVNKSQAPFIAETKKQAKNKADLLFQTGNRKILIENYIQGVEYTKYILSDGINIINLADIISYFDESATNNLNYLNQRTTEKIKNEIMPKFIDSLFEEGIDHRGLLGINFIIDKSQNVFFKKFKPFFDKLDIDIILNTVEEDFSDLLYCCASGNLADNYKKIKTNSKYAIAQNNDREIIFACANTMNNAVKIAETEGADKKLIEEAICAWTYNV